MQDITNNEALAQSRQQLEALRPSVPSRIVSFPQMVMPDGRTRQDFDAIQEQLGMFGVQDFVTMMGEVIEDFTKGEFGIKLGQLFTGEASMPTDFTAEKVDEAIEENMAFVQAFLKLIRIVPSLQLDIYCLSLGIAPDQRDWFKSAIQRPPSQGGLSVDDGFDLLYTFIRQNAKLIRRFFSEKGAELVRVFRTEVLEEVEGTATEVSTDTPPTNQSPGLPTGSPGSTPSSISSGATLASVS
jgi:hypothetical protein